MLTKQSQDSIKCWNAYNSRLNYHKYPNVKSSQLIQ